MAVTTVTPMPAAATFGPRRWTIEEFERIPDDILPEGERLELIDGLIYTKMGQNDPHIYALHFAFDALRAVFGPDFAVLMQASLKIGEDAKPEPDLAVLKGRLGDLQGQRLRPASDILLLVEVSDTTLNQDRNLKASLYARHEVPEYWIVNLQNRTLEVRRRPRPELGEYAETIVFREGESVPAGDGEVAVADLLPKAV